MRIETRDIPEDLPFIIGDIIGSGAFATCVPDIIRRADNHSSVRVAKDLHSSKLYAVKFIDKIASLNGYDANSHKGKTILHQISLEVNLHRTCSEHRNVIELFATRETPVWRWIAMEFAEGGDLFDKIGITKQRQNHR